MRGRSRFAIVLLVVVGACDARRDPPRAAPRSPERAARPPAPVPGARAAVPPARPAVRPATAAAWARAEADETAAAWDAAGDAAAEERAACTGDCAATAHAVLLARKSAMLADPPAPPAGDDEVALPPRVEGVIDALDDYISLADPADPELPGMKFLAASVSSRWRQPDTIARLEALLREHRQDESAEYAANLLLDALLRAERLAELRAWVLDLLGDQAFLLGKDALRQTLERLRDLTGADRPR